jgi:hypothetical protein
MKEKYQILNSKKQQIATVLYFFEEEFQTHVGIAITPDMSNYHLGLYEDNTIEEVIGDLITAKLNMDYDSYKRVE